MAPLNFRENSLRISLSIIGLFIFALIANATIIPDDTTIVGDLTVQSTDGIDVNPGSDVDTDLISIGVTGSPKIKWNETQDALQFIEKLILGTNAILTKTVNGSSYTSKMSLDTDTTTDSGGIDITRHGDSDASYGSLSLLRSRGTHASPTIVQSGDLISSIVGLGYDGVDYEPVSSIEMYSDETPGSNDMPGRIDFKTVSDGSRVLNQVMRIGRRSDVMIGTTTSDSSSILEVQSVTKGSRPFPRMAQTQRDAIVSPATGLSIFNNDFNTFDFYNGSSWLSLLGTTTTQEFSGKTVSGSLKFKESGGGSNYTAFQAPASLTGDVTFTLPDGDGTSGQALKTDGAGTLSWGNASGGSGGINYISNPDAETDTTGYATYADAAGTNPVNGTGGSANITWTRTTSTPLRSTGSFLLTKDAANRQGEGASYDFTIAEADKAKVLNIEFEYILSSGTFVAGTSSTDSDVTVWIYDVTNSTLTQPSSFKLLSNSTTISDRFSATFQTASNSTSYRLIFHVGSTSASAYVLKIDDIKIGPSNYIYGTPITDWQSFTPTGSWSTNTTYIGKWRRVGDSMELDVSLTLAGAPTATGLTVNMPSGYTIDTTKISASTGGSTPILGVATSWDSGTTIYQGYITYNSTTTVIVYANGASSTYTNAQQVTNTVPMTWASGDVQNLKFSVPILGWSSSVQMSDSADTRVVSFSANTSTTSATTSTPFVYTVKDHDTHGAYSTSTGKFTAPVQGKYHFSFNNYTGATAAQAKLYKNGTAVYTGSSSVASTSVGSGSYVLNLVAGDTVEVRPEITATASTGATFNTFSGFRLSGPSAIAASESVNARYTTTAGQSVSNASLTIIDFGTKDFDSHGAVTTGASWKFTAPISGKYRVTANLTTTSTGNFSAAEYIENRIYKNGSIYAAKLQSDFNGSTSNKSVQISASINLLAGDYIDIREYQTSGGSMPLESASGYNWIDIERVGN